MSRIRMGAFLALAAGILISTGGCAESPTASEAAPAAASADAQQSTGFIFGGGRTDAP
jgi:hypothetical protein